MVKTTLELKCRALGGKLIAESLRDAEVGLASLAGKASDEVRSELCCIARLTGDGGSRPDADALDEIRVRADRSLGYCAALDRPGLSDCLLKLCLLCDAVSDSGIWLEGTFGPLLTILELVARGQMSREEVEILMDGIARCIEVYQSSSSAQPVLS